MLLSLPGHAILVSYRSTLTNTAMEKNDKNKIREPFPPEETPNPPQIIDPNIRNERNEPNGPVDKKKQKPAPDNEQQQDSGKRLGDPTEITDETTI
jgi:hypothetical protein